MKQAGIAALIAVAVILGLSAKDIKRYISIRRM
ncbi:hypothetical protein BH24ACT5_BH24ACT5_17010 [soil metagenome]